ncbi:Bud site selection protein bud4 [Borealophlyctis nickersoniae]|nr:Bud site selection protein bud4 [Borealophlyctis nickersoniae]
MASNEAVSALNKFHTAIHKADLPTVTAFISLAPVALYDDADDMVKAAIIRTGVGKMMGWGTHNLGAAAEALLALANDESAKEGEGVRWEILRLIVESTPPNTLSTARWGYGNTILHLASCLGLPQTIQFLLSYGCSSMVRNELGYAPPDVAANEVTRAAFSEKSAGAAGTGRSSKKFSWPIVAPLIGVKVAPAAESGKPKTGTQEGSDTQPDDEERDAAQPHPEPDTTPQLDISSLRMRGAVSNSPFLKMLRGEGSGQNLDPKQPPPKRTSKVGLPAAWVRQSGKESRETQSSIGNPSPAATASYCGNKSKGVDEKSDPKGESVGRHVSTRDTSGRGQAKDDPTSANDANITNENIGTSANPNGDPLTNNETESAGSKQNNQSTADEKKEDGKALKSIATRLAVTRNPFVTADRGGTSAEGSSNNKSKNIAVPSQTNRSPPKPSLNSASEADPSETGEQKKSGECQLNESRPPVVFSRGRGAKRGVLSQWPFMGGTTGSAPSKPCAAKAAAEFKPKTPEIRADVPSAEVPIVHVQEVKHGNKDDTISSANDTLSAQPASTEVSTGRIASIRAAWAAKVSATPTVPVGSWRDKRSLFNAFETKAKIKAATASSSQHVDRAESPGAEPEVDSSASDVPQRTNEKESEGEKAQKDPPKDKQVTSGVPVESQRSQGNESINFDIPRIEIGSLFDDSDWFGSIIASDSSSAAPAASRQDAEALKEDVAENSNQSAADENNPLEGSKKKEERSDSAVVLDIAPPTKEQENPVNQDPPPLPAKTSSTTVIRAQSRPDNRDDGDSLASELLVSRAAKQSRNISLTSSIVEDIIGVAGKLRFGKGKSGQKDGGMSKMKKKTVRFGRAWKGELETRHVVAEDNDFRSVKPEAGGLLVMRISQLYDSKVIVDADTSVDLVLAQGETQYPCGRHAVPPNQSSVQLDVDCAIFLQPSTPIDITLIFRQPKSLATSPPSPAKRPSSSSPSHTPLKSRLMSAPARMLGSLTRKRGAHMAAIMAIAEEEEWETSGPAVPSPSDAEPGVLKRGERWELKPGSMLIAQGRIQEADSWAREATASIIGRACEMKVTNVSEGSRVNCELGKISCQAMYVPSTPDADQSLLPHTLEECEQAVHAREWNETLWKVGYLWQEGGDLKDWRRRYFRFVGGKMHAYHGETREHRITIDLSGLEQVHASELHRSISRASSYSSFPSSPRSLSPSRPSQPSDERASVVRPPEDPEECEFALEFKDGRGIAFRVENGRLERDEWAKAIAETLDKLPDYDVPGWFVAAEKLKSC